MFFFNDTAITEICTLSLPDALPIYRAVEIGSVDRCHEGPQGAGGRVPADVELAEIEKAAPQGTLAMLQRQAAPPTDRKSTRLNSSQRQYLVCRLLLAKKKHTKQTTS